MTVLQKNKKLAAGIGVAAAAAAVLAVGAGTYASFTDTEAAPSTTFAAGTLNLTVGSPAAVPPVVLTNLAPGSQQAISVPIDNAGSIDGVLSATYAVQGTENGCVEPETDVETTCDDGSELLEQLILSYNGSDVGPLAAAAGTNFPLGDLAAAPAGTTVDFLVKVPQGAKNDIMTDTATMTITFTLTQK